VSPVKIFETGMEFTATSLPAGKLFTDGKTFLKAAHPEGFLHLLSLQIPGKKQLAVQEFLKGFRLDETARFI
jgi:methionyl-tRNA formyltransferase